MTDFELNLANGIAEALVALPFLPLAVFLERKKKSQIVRGAYVLFSIASVGLVMLLKYLYVQSVIHNTLSEDHIFKLIVLGSIIIIGKYLLLMLTIRRLRNIGWSAWSSIFILIPQINIIVWLVFAAWPSRKPDYFEAKKLAEEKKSRSESWLEESGEGAG